MNIPSAAPLVRGLAVVQALFCLYGCSATSPEANADRQGDPQLAARVRDALAGDERLYSAHIDVTAEHGGVVHLSGMVASINDLIQAKRDAGAIAEVRAIVEDLQIEEGNAALARTTL
jgi:osmotically-inducible protein OsmY